MSRKKLSKLNGVAQRVWQLMKSTGLTTSRQVGAATQISPNTVTRGLREDRWSDKTLRAISSALNVPFQWLKYGVEIPDRTGKVETYVVGAGRHFAVADDAEPEYTAMPDPGAVTGYRVDGDSMEPLARNGQIVLAERATWPRDGDLAYIELNDGTAMFRRVHIVAEGTGAERWLLQCVNPAHPVSEIRRADVRAVSTPSMR